jgi:hypothetical protein
MDRFRKFFGGIRRAMRYWQAWAVIGGLVFLACFFAFFRKNSKKEVSALREALKKSKAVDAIFLNEIKKTRTERDAIKRAIDDIFDSLLRG